MEVTILGTSGAWPAPGGAASGYLVRHDGFNLVLDLGNGAFANLQRHVPHTEIGGIIVSHEHWDHCMDVYPLFMARFFHPEPLPPLPLVSPPGVFERLAKLEDDEGALMLRETFDHREVQPGEGFELGPFRIQTRPLPHWVVNMGTRIEADGGVLVYTGDTGPSPELEAISNEADVLIAEASWLDGQDQGREPYHLTARQAGAHADKAGAGHLILSHFWPTNDRGRSREQAAEEFDGTLTVAAEDLRIDLAPGDQSARRE